jgi:thiol-disulfide isomerase/thioredoxin
MRLHSHLIALLLLGTVPSWGQTDARKVMEEASAAIKAAGAIRYDGRGDLGGDLLGRLPTMTGTVVAAPGTEGQANLRVEGEMTPPNAERTVKMQLAREGASITIADHAQRIYIKREGADANWLMLAAHSLLVPELGAGQPLSRELSEGKLEVVGTETIGGVACDQIRVGFPNGDETTWAIARTDHLPRRVQRKVTQPAQGTITTTITKIEPAGSLPADAFAIAKPEGFQEPIAPDRARGNGPIAAGSEAPDFTLKTPEGQEVSLKALRGKVVLLDFWATWCGPCRMAMPGVQKLHDKYKDKPVAVFGVNCRERGKVDPADWMRKNGFTYPLLLNGNEVASKYKVSGIPMFCLIGPDGKVLMSAAGFSQQMEQELDRKIEAALADSAAAASPVAGS